MTCSLSESESERTGFVAGACFRAAGSADAAGAAVGAGFGAALAATGAVFGGVDDVLEDWEVDSERSTVSFEMDLGAVCCECALLSDEEELVAVAVAVAGALDAGAEVWVWAPPCVWLFVDAGFSDFFSSAFSGLSCFSDLSAFSALSGPAVAVAAGACFASLAAWCDSCALLRSSAGAVDERIGGELGGELRLPPDLLNSAASFARPVGGASEGGLGFDSGAVCPLLPAACEDCFAGSFEAFGGRELFACGRFSSTDTHELSDGLLVDVVGFVVVLLFDTCGFELGALTCCVLDML